MRQQMLLAPLTALAIASAALLPGTASGSASTSTPAASPTPASKKDPCATSKSKWAHAQCQQYNSSAPGDEYFGRMKISYLGIDNTFRDGSISAGDFTIEERLIAKLAFADEALQRWAAKYPSDPQLSRAYFLGFVVFRKVYTQPGQETAWRYVQLLAKKYPNTYFGKTAKALMAKGFTEHWFAAAQPCPTPLPKGVKPVVTPTPTQSPTPAPGQPTVAVMDPPCIPPTPSPTPSTSPSPTPKTH